MTDSKASQNSQDSALATMPSIPRDNGEPVFAAPWQAEIFAITLCLHEKNLFTWPEWAELLASKIKEAQKQGDPDLGDTYYNHWLAALENMIILKEIGETDQLNSLYRAWDEAAQSTPHGEAIELKHAQSG